MTNVMVGEQGNAQGWTFDTFKKYVDERLKSAETAVSKAEDQINHRFASVNEFRGALSDLSNRMMPRQEYDIQHKSLADRIDGLDKRLAALQVSLTELTASASGKKQGFGFIGSIVLGLIAAIGAFIALITLVIQHMK